MVTRHNHGGYFPPTENRAYSRDMTELPFLAFDADNHYYEAEDAFIRHIDPMMKKRCMQWAEIDGKQRFLVGGRVNKFIPNPTFDPIAAPGSLENYFRGKNEAGDMDLGKMFGDLAPISEHPGYRHRDARLALMDEQGLETVLLFTSMRYTLGRWGTRGALCTGSSPPWSFHGFLVCSYQGLIQ